jgi:hypothetical protein
MQENSTSEQLTEDDILSNFCYMVLEEFMVKRNLKNSLQTFRDEWKRPNEVLRFSLYDNHLTFHLTGNGSLFLV